MRKICKHRLLSLVAGGLAYVAGTAAFAVPDTQAGTHHQPQLERGAGESKGSRQPGWDHTVRSLKRYGYAQKDKVVAEAKRAMKAADRRIAALEELSQNNLKRLSATAKAEQREAMQAVREQRKELSAWVARLEASSTSTWQETRDNLAAAYDRLGLAFENMAERLRADEPS
jgi:hypothetical protein